MIISVKLFYGRLVFARLLTPVSPKVKGDFLLLDFLRTGEGLMGCEAILIVVEGLPLRYYFLFCLEMSRFAYQIHTRG